MGFLDRFKKNKQNLKSDSNQERKILLAEEINGLALEASRTFNDESALDGVRKLVMPAHTVDLGNDQTLNMFVNKMIQEAKNACTTSNLSVFNASTKALGEFFEGVQKESIRRCYNNPTYVQSSLQLFEEQIKLAMIMEQHRNDQIKDFDAAKTMITATMARIKAHQEVLRAIESQQS